MPRIMLIAAMIAVAAAGTWWLTRGTAQSGSGAPMVEVMVPELSAEALAGKTIYDAKCASCHGEDGAGDDEAGPPLVHKIYEPGHHGDFAFARATLEGARGHHWPFGDMKPVEGVSEADVARIITYVRELQRANGIR